MNGRLDTDGHFQEANSTAGKENREELIMELLPLLKIDPHNCIDVCDSCGEEVGIAAEVEMWVTKQRNADRILYVAEIEYWKNAVRFQEKERAKCDDEIVALKGQLTTRPDISKEEANFILHGAKPCDCGQATCPINILYKKFKAIANKSDPIQDSKKE